MKILITGGSSGLGKAITEQLSAGHEVFFTYYNTEDNIANTSSLYLDMTSTESIKKLSKWIETEQPEVLINNAITGLRQNHSHKLSGENHLESFSSNVAPVIDITNAFIVQARKRKSGKIINVLTSYLIGKPPIGLSQYTAQKAYLLSLNKSWASENIKFNVTSNAVSPSIMRTELTSDTDERIFENMIEGHPLKRLIEPKEVAECIEYMVNSSLFMNGQNIVMNHAENL